MSKHLFLCLIFVLVKNAIFDSLKKQLKSEIKHIDENKHHVIESEIKNDSTLKKFYLLCQQTFIYEEFN